MPHFSMTSLPFLLSQGEEAVLHVFNKHLFFHIFICSFFNKTLQIEVYFQLLISKFKISLILFRLPKLTILFLAQYTISYSNDFRCYFEIQFASTFKTQSFCPLLFSTGGVNSCVFLLLKGEPGIVVEVPFAGSYQYAFIFSFNTVISTVMLPL